MTKWIAWGWHAFSNGKYLSIIGDNINSGSLLQAAEPKRNDSQKFKVIKKDAGQFKFVTINNLVIDCDCNNGGKLSIAKDAGTKNQIFEILEVKTMKKLSIN